MQLRILAAASAVALLIAVPRSAAGQARPTVSSDSAAPPASAPQQAGRDSVRTLAPVRVEGAPSASSLGSRLWHVQETRDVILDARRENRRLERELRDCDEKIEQLAARLARAKAVHDSLHHTRLAEKPQTSVALPGVEFR